MKPSVALVGCDAAEYPTEPIARAVRTAVDSLGGIDRFVPRDARVLVKINQLGKYPADAAINTHPAVLAAVLDLLLPVTRHVAVGDGLLHRGHEQFGSTGADAVCRERGVAMVNFKDEPYENVPVDGRRLENIPIARSAATADVIVNLPKLKTHSLTLLTCAVKNAYGYLPQKARVSYHKRFFVPSDFAEAVVDIYRAAPATLTVVDAVMGLEGYGAGSRGRPRRIGAIVAGGNAVAVDTVAAGLIGIEGSRVPSTAIAARRGMGPDTLEEIGVVGDDIASLAVADFALPENALALGSLIDRLPESAARLLGRLIERMRGKPVASADLCIACGYCVRHCPVQAVRIEDGVAAFDYEKCIRCYCCQEFCPKGAIDVRGTWPARAFKAIRKATKPLRHRKRN
mgnify:CR=1 FL=1